MRNPDSTGLTGGGITPAYALETALPTQAPTRSARAVVLPARLLAAALALLLSAGLSAGAAVAGSTQTSRPTDCPGVWTVVSSPNTLSPQNYLTGVAVVAPNDIWAVGYSANSVDAIQRTLVEHWDGTSWNIVSSPSPGSANNALNAVIALSANNVWAVGYYNDEGYHGQTLVEHWDGSTWRVVPSPNVDPSSNHNSLWGVTAVSGSDLWAVGVYRTFANYDFTLVEHWDGVRWTIVPSPNPSTPNPGGIYNYLASAAAVSANDVWAVGSYVNSYSVVQTLVEHWDGSTWSVVPSPNVGVRLWGVAAVSANDVWAVGSYSVPSGNWATLVEHWDGATWSVVPSPNPGAYSNELIAVAAVSTGDVWAVGNRMDTSTSSHRALVERWDGTSWNVVSSPNIGSVGNHLHGIASVSAIDVVSVGTYSNGSGVQTLVERYSEPCTPVLVGHVSWQGRPSQPSALQEVPVTLTLRSAITEVNYPVQTTDASGFFTVPVGSLPAGTYDWRIKSPKYLANSGTAALTGAAITSAEMGLMEAGDANNDNQVNAIDYAILRNTFGRAAGESGYDEQADFTGDRTVNAGDFTLLRANFGHAGAPPISPGGR